MSDIRRRPIGSWAAIEAWEREQAGQNPDLPDGDADIMDSTESAHRTEVSVERANHWEI